MAIQVQGFGFGCVTLPAYVLQLAVVIRDFLEP